MFVSDDAVTRV